MIRRAEPFLVLVLGVLLCLIAAASHAAPPADPAQAAADSLVAQGCTIRAQNLRMILVDCGGKVVRLMRQAAR